MDRNKAMITRSVYLNGLRCLRMIWRDRHAPIDAHPSSSEEAMIAQAARVRALALSSIEGLKTVPKGKMEEREARTGELLCQKAEMIANAVFRKGDISACVDVLECGEDGSLAIYLLSSALHLRESFLEDLAYQAWLLRELGYQVNHCYVMHLNRNYERIGDLDLSALFEKEEMIRPVQKRIPKVKEKIEIIRAALKDERCPETQADEFCRTPWVCGYFDSCFHPPEGKTVFLLANMGFGQKRKLYREGLGDLKMLLETGKLNPAQTLQARHELEELPDEIDRKNIRRFLDSLRFPMYFLDFESFQPAIPEYDHTHPYDQVVFQYSLHILKEIDEEAEHREFLAEPGPDPRRKLAISLCRDIPADVCVIVYNERFEKERIRELAALFPDLSDHLLRTADNIRDLAVPFQSRWFYSRAMHGKYSIKYVLPALFPEERELNYQNLNGIHEGQAASFAYLSMREMSEKEQQACREELLAYCALDTLAMVKIVQKLSEFCKET